MRDCELRDQLLDALKDHEILDPNSHKLTDEKSYTEWDLNAIRECNCVVAFMDSSNPSGYGMSLEIGYAHGLGKTVIYLDALGNDWRQKYFGMVRSVSRTVQSIAEFQHALAHRDAD